MRRAGAVVAVVAGLLAALLVPDGAAADGARWSWPVDPHPVVRGFQAPVDRFSAGHRGIDVGSAAGVAVRAPADGVVAFAGRVADRPVVAIDHDSVRSTLEPVAPDVAVGATVRRGQVVGHLSSGGDHAPGVLHLGARVRRDGAWVYVSPLLLLGGARRAVLLPLSALPA